MDSGKDFFVQASHSLFWASDGRVARLKQNRHHHHLHTFQPDRLCVETNTLWAEMKMKPIFPNTQSSPKLLLMVPEIEPPATATSHSRFCWLQNNIYFSQYMISNTTYEGIKQNCDTLSLIAPDQTIKTWLAAIYTQVWSNLKNSTIKKDKLQDLTNKTVETTFLVEILKVSNPNLNDDITTIHQPV